MLRIKELKDLLRTSVDAFLILDPFLGSGVG